MFVYGFLAGVAASIILGYFILYLEILEDEDDEGEKDNG